MWFGQQLDFERDFRSYLTAEKLQSLVTDPYHQLNLVFSEDFYLDFTGDISISCKSLTITADQLTTSTV